MEGALERIASCFIEYFNAVVTLAILQTTRTSYTWVRRTITTQKDPSKGSITRGLQNRNATDWIHATST
jgi:hypothetical protein